MNTKNDYRQYLKPEIVSRLSKLDLVARLVVEGFITGLHRSPYHGFSVEFSEYRPYNIGDPLRHIDWKVWGRTDRYYVKQFEEETNLRSYLLLDASRSTIARAASAMRTRAPVSVRTGRRGLTIGSRMRSSGEKGTGGRNHRPPGLGPARRPTPTFRRDYFTSSIFLVKTLSPACRR